VVLNTAFGQETFAVDTHIFRVCNRTKLAPGRTPREVEDALERSVPPAYRRDAHHWLILHGRYVCIARKPACPRCVLRDLCEYRDKTPAQDETAPRGRGPATDGTPRVPAGTAGPAGRAAQAGDARDDASTGASAPKPRGPRIAAGVTRAKDGTGGGGRHAKRGAVKRSAATRRVAKARA
jgi:adenine-specific DNA glycosylase